ncbi:MAG TPA: hypothetical protein VG476_13120, partial [Acidimicrobiales bacterium]|nr:hypothetical protein [Acidimicrobiales bacterium]
MLVLLLGASWAFWLANEGFATPGSVSMVRVTDRVVTSISVDAPSTTSAVGGTTAAVETVTVVEVKRLSGEGKCSAALVMAEATPEPV